MIFPERVSNAGVFDHDLFYYTVMDIEINFFTSLNKIGGKKDPILTIVSHKGDPLLNHDQMNPSTLQPHQSESGFPLGLTRILQV